MQRKKKPIFDQQAFDEIMQQNPESAASLKDVSTNRHKHGSMRTKQLKKLERNDAILRDLTSQSIQQKMIPLNTTISPQCLFNVNGENVFYFRGTMALYNKLFSALNKPISQVIDVRANTTFDYQQFQQKYKDYHILGFYLTDVKGFGLDQLELMVMFHNDRVNIILENKERDLYRKILIKSHFAEIQHFRKKLITKYVDAVSDIDWYKITSAPGRMLVAQNGIRKRDLWRQLIYRDRRMDEMRTRQLLLQLIWYRGIGALFSGLYQ